MKNSEWITMEMIVAKEEAGQRKLFFVPCVIEEVDLPQLPEVSRKFFGMDLSNVNGFEVLVEILLQAVQNR